MLEYIIIIIILLLIICNFFVKERFDAKYACPKCGRYVFGPKWWHITGYPGAGVDDITSATYKYAKK